MKSALIAGVALVSAFLPFVANAQYYGNYGSGSYGTPSFYPYGPSYYSSPYGGDANGMYYYSYPNPTNAQVMHPYYTLALPDSYGSPTPQYNYGGYNSGYGYQPNVPVTYGGGYAGCGYGYSSTCYPQPQSSYGYGGYGYGVPAAYLSGPYYY
jgi:hypothetical protein